MATLTLSPDYSVLLGRLKRLECESRMMKRLGALILIAMSALILTGQTSKNSSLDVNNLVIRDASGNVRIELGTLEDHSPILKMFGGSDGKSASLMLSSGQKGSGLTFFGRGVTMLADGDPGPSLVLADGKGGTSIDAGSLQTYDNNNFHAFIGRTSTLDTKTGSTTQSTAGSIQLTNKDGKIVWSVP